MAELADALRSGRSESNLMRVQVPPSALQMGSPPGEFCFSRQQIFATVDFRGSQVESTKFVCFCVKKMTGIGKRGRQGGGIIRVNQRNSSLVKTRSRRVLFFVSFLCLYSVFTIVLFTFQAP